MLVDGLHGGSIAVGLAFLSGTEAILPDLTQFLGGGV